MSEMAGTSGISMNKLLSASSGDDEADGQVEILAGPIKTKQETVKFP